MEQLIPWNIHRKEGEKVQGREWSLQVTLLPSMWDDLPCQEEPFVISEHLLLPPSWQLGSLGYNKFSPSDVPTMVLYCFKSLTKSSTVECAPLPNVHVSSSVSFYCENKSRCSGPFWMALCKRRHGGIPYWNRHFPLILIAAFSLATPVSLVPALPDSCWWSWTLLWFHTGGLQQKWDLDFLCPDHRAICQFIKYFQE